MVAPLLLGSFAVASALYVSADFSNRSVKQEIQKVSMEVFHNTEEVISGSASKMQEKIPQVKGSIQWIK